MTAEYPKEAQNPPTIPGARPEDQPNPRTRVPDKEEQTDQPKLKPESEMSEGENHKADVKPATFDYDSPERVTRQEGQGQGG